MPKRSLLVWFFLMGLAATVLHRRERKRQASPKERATAKAYNATKKDERSAYYKRRRSEPEWRDNANRRSAADYQRAKPKRYQAHRAWLAANADKNRAWHRTNARRIRATIPYYNIRNRLSSRLWHAVTASKGKKAAKTEALIGCTVKELQQQLQAQFTDGMTWEKFLRGEIHIDHKIPCAAFDLADPEQQKICFHFTNLRPMWKKDNLSKSDRLEDGRHARMKVTTP